EFQARKESFFGVLETVDRLDADGEPMFDDEGFPVTEELVNEYITAEIIKYEIKEDWFFDKQRSVLDVRIIGISPVVYYKNANGDIAAEKNLFWLYFPECRYVFQNFFVYNERNDAQRMSFDDLFWKRDFSSIIHKESNIFNRKVAPIWVGLDALLESERIKGEMFQLEHDIWNL
ncbi:MAG: gliding motility associated protein GldN, partial [Parvicella sp.]